MKEIIETGFDWTIQFKLGLWLCMDKLLKNAFKLQIQSKEGFEFEEFIDELFLLKYGVDNYIPIRRNKDKGNDGTILDEKKMTENPIKQQMIMHGIDFKEDAKKTELIMIV